ncbi:ankyrin repeat-containing protein BDA1-like [Alnus glutinosa]|uniref:ankyrin repeat-containing protein BDA1-like n=1 Tax=Alnus glutinosa TaxID=3517 RepID=UPI002D781D46|nr:ankyrin repeat-containing protein BDA1-like [Alnus glutinosa]
MDRGQDETANMAELYVASRNGCVSTLTTLIQRDPHILDRVSLTSFSETPLHIAALLGYLEFSEVLLRKKPKLAEEVDSRGRTPLHLASAEGYTDIVKVLLQANACVGLTRGQYFCLVRDQDERIALHLAAMRGRIEIIKMLISAQPESIWVNLNGDSVLHLCVRFNHLDALRVLVESDNGEELFLSSKDHHGNSILHLAVVLKQMKSIKYLLSIPKIRRGANVKNKIGYTALDVLEECPRDFEWFEIKDILKEAGVTRSMDPSLPPAPSGTSVDEAQSAGSWFRRLWKCVCLSLGKRLKRNWTEEERGVLMLVATVIATMAFQAGVSPPGGVWQEHKYNSTVNFSYCEQHTNFEAGTAVLAYCYPGPYLVLISTNSISLFASLCVILLVTCGFPLTSRLFRWFFTLAMTTAVVCMTITYTLAMVLINPSHLYDYVKPYLTPVDVMDKVHLFDGLSLLPLTLVGIWMGVVVLVGVIHMIRPLSWAVKKWRNFKPKLTRGLAEDPANV